MKMKEKKKGEEDDGHGLPMDVMSEIWLRLPTASLARFRFVSKSWGTSLTDPNFIYNHLRTSKQNTTNFKILITTERDRVYGAYPLHFHQIPHVSDPNAFTLQGDHSIHPYINSDCRYVVVLGSCNGLICFIYPQMDAAVCLLNPCTREYRMFHISFNNSTTHGPWFYNVFGFGYTSAAMDYEFVRVAEAENNSSQAYVYSLATNTCRTIPNIPYKFKDAKHSGQLVNDALHWLACPTSKCVGMLCYNLVVAYDIRGESFREVPQPSYQDEGFGNMSLTEFQDKLCICCYYNTGLIDVWVMEEYGVMESWAKLFHVEGTSYCRPLCYTKAGCALLYFDKEDDLVLYDPKTNSKSQLMLGDRKVACDGRTFTESLVELN